MADFKKMASAVQLFKSEVEREKASELISTKENNNSQAVQVENETGRAEYVTGRYLPLNKTVVMAKLNQLRL